MLYEAIMDGIARIITQRRLKNKVIIEKTAYVSKDTVFEGANRITRGCKIYGSRFGYGSYVGTNTTLANISVGRFSCIGPNVKQIIGEHPLNFVTMHPAFYSIRKQIGFSFVKEQRVEEFRYADISTKTSIIVGNDVWIAAECRLLEGIKIGDGAAILAGAVVTKDVPPYAVVGGVPAKIVRYRFEQEDVDWLMKLKWWDKDSEWLKKYASYFNDVKRMREELEKVCEND